MRTISLTKVNIIRRSLFVVVLMLALSMMIVIGSRPSYAATQEGEYTLKGEYTLDANFTNVTTMPDKLDPTKFKLYRVGSFVVGSPYVKLDSPYSKMQINLPLDKDPTDVVPWTKAWLQCALTLENNLPKDADLPDEMKPIAFESDSKGDFIQSGLSNGLYLLVGESQELKDYPNVGDKSYWWPQPMLVSILNGDREIKVKPMYGRASHLKVRKEWQGIPDNLLNIVRLDKIKVNIYYQPDIDSEKQLRYKEVVLSDKNDIPWTFEWDPKRDEGDPSKWSVEEVIDPDDQEEFDRNFSITIAENFVEDSDGREVMTITNKYDRYLLQIEKTLDSYVDNGEGNSTAIVFELSGYAENPDDPEALGDRVYHKFVGIQFDGSTDTQTLLVKDIPRGLKKLIVKEVDSGNFEPEDEAEKEAVLVASDLDPKGIYQVSFSNKLNNHNHQSGVINKFKIKDNIYVFDKSLGIGE